MSNSFWRKSTLLVAGIFLSHMIFTSAAFSPLVQAQPDLKEKAEHERKSETDTNRYNRSKRGPNRGESRRSSEEGIRRMLFQAGVGEPALQDAVLEYVREDLEARKPLREQGARLFRALREGDFSEAQLSVLVSEYRAAQTEEKKRQEHAEKLLDAKIGFSKNPRLEAMLLLSGLIGENSGPMMLPRRGSNERSRVREETKTDFPEKPEGRFQRFNRNHTGTEGTVALRDKQNPQKPRRINELPGDA